MVEDFVVYELPLGPLGLLLHRFAVRPRLDAIFDYRQARIAVLLARAEEQPFPVTAAPSLDDLARPGQRRRRHGEGEAPSPDGAMTDDRG